MQAYTIVSKAYNYRANYILKEYKKDNKPIKEALNTLEAEFRGIGLGLYKELYSKIITTILSSYPNLLAYRTKI